MRSILLAAATALAAALSPAPAGAHEYIQWIPTPQRYEGAGAGGKHLDAAVSADGKHVVDLRLSGARETCRYPGGSKTFRAGAGGDAFSGDAFVVRGGRFKRIAVNRAYGNYFRTTLGGTLSGDERVISVVWNLYGRQKMLVKGRGMVQATCTAHATAKAMRWAPADWSGRTAQGRPISFHLGAFEDQTAPITNLTGGLQVTCEDGQSQVVTLDAPADAGSLVYRDEISKKVAFLNLNSDLVSSLADMRWAKAAGSVPTIRGDLRTYEQYVGDSSCPETSIGFSARPVG